MFLQNGRYHHIQCAPGEIGRYVLLPGDPFRTDRIAEFLDDATLVAHNREHKTWTGTLLGEKVSVTSTGMGCPSTAICVEELIACGAETLIRVGTAGRIAAAAQDMALLGVINTAAVRDEGTTPQYIPIEYPAVADRHVVAALADAAAERDYAFLEGITHSKDAFYSQFMPDSVPLAEHWEERLEIFRRGNVLCSEMEAAAIFVISGIRGKRAGAVMAFDRTNTGKNTVDCAIETACGAIKKLILAERGG
ncbi:nucleoside phosphorylase [Oscillospiraceae bacterium OttesenSCG-928-F05]|nr:nucleoside phosphorylase [Oscillospiraceae bacterium OttesenSCG-928-F05]